VEIQPRLLVLTGYALGGIPLEGITLDSGKTISMTTNRRAGCVLCRIP